MLSFPALLALGLPPVVANATNTVAIWPGTVGSIWGFRPELQRVEPSMRRLIIPCLLGGVAGAVLLRLTSSALFSRLVPFLILFATVLIMIQTPIQKRLKTRHSASRRSASWMLAASGILFLVGVYGGYFGAGMSILNLAILGVLGMTDILEMNALTSLFSLCINGVASIIFIFAGLIAWPYVAVMAGGAILGGYGAAGAARKIGRVMVRRFVMLVGITISVVLLIRMFRG